MDNGFLGMTVFQCYLIEQATLLYHSESSFYTSSIHNNTRQLYISVFISYQTSQNRTGEPYAHKFCASYIFGIRR